MTYYVTITVEETISIDDARDLDHAIELAKEQFDATAHDVCVTDAWDDKDD